MTTIDWNTLRPSSQPPMDAAGIYRLPAGMVVLVRGNREAFPEPEPVCVRPYQPRSGYVSGMPWDRGARAWRPEMEVVLAIQRAMQPPKTAKTVWLPRLPRLSFALTEAAVRRREKDVTRRLAAPRWWTPGRLFLGVDCVRRAGAAGLCLAVCGPSRAERLDEITADDVRREGFAGWSPERFLEMFLENAPGLHPGDPVVRLEFAYVEIPQEEAVHAGAG
jgi:hypothetical protein